MLWEYGVDGRLLLAVKSLHYCSGVCVGVGGVKPQTYTVVIGFRQGCVLSPLLFIVYISWIDSHSRDDEGVTAGSCRINRVVFADDLVLLAYSEKGLHHAVDRFSAACDQAGIKVNTEMAEVLCLSRNPRQCTLQVNDNTLQQVEKYKFLWVVFMSDGRRKQIDTRIGRANTVLRELNRCVVTNGRAFKHCKAVSFTLVFVPILTSRDSSYHCSTMWPEWPRIGEASPAGYTHGKRPRSRPRIRWSDYISNLPCSGLGVKPTELSEIAVDRGLFRVLLGLLLSPFSPKENRHKNE